MYELKPLSAELRLEIDEKQSKVNGTEAKIVFKNSSVIKVVTASDSARGNNKVARIVSNYCVVPSEKSGRLNYYKQANQSGRLCLTTQPHATHRQ